MLATLSLPTPPLYSSKPTITDYIKRFIASSGLRDRPGGQLGLRPNSVRNYISFSAGLGTVCSTVKEGPYIFGLGS